VTTLVDSNNGAIASGAVALRFDPSELSADTLPVTALGDTGEFIPPSHAIATTAQSATAIFFM
jgi:hypothetical protein